MAALIALSVSAVVAGAMQSRSGSLLTIGMILLAAASAYALAPRVRARVTGWLEPWSVPLGSGYQFIQAEYVTAAGGVAGAASGEAISRVPEIHTDLVLVAIGGRIGIVGATAVLALCAILVLRCVIAASRYGSGTGQYLALSLASLLAVQIILIVGGVLRVLPLTGLTLPLVSYGGTSMLVTFFGLGLILGVGASGTTRDIRSSDVA
jgi:cell division protein FtsW (lipid II flippase)